MAKAKPKGRKKKTSKRKPARKQTARTSQLMRIIAGLGILIFLVVTAGVLVHILLQRDQPRLADKGQSGPKTEPPFEIYPKEAPPPPSPKDPLPPARDQLPKVALIIDDLGNDS